jgi:signal transduction histidine kinase
LSKLSPLRSIFPDLEEAALRQGLRDLLAGRIDRFAHAHVGQTPLGPRPQPWEVSLCQVGAAMHFMAAPTDIEDGGAVMTALRGALREAIAGRIRTERHYDVDLPGGEKRRVCVTPVRLGRRTHLLAFPDELVIPTQAPAADRLLLAQEEERHRIAIELHDSTSQHLVAVSLGLMRLRRFVRVSRAEKRLVDEMSRMLQAAIREIRTFSYLMNPPQLERDGLEATVRRFVAGFETRTGIKTSLAVIGAPDTASAAVQHTLFRVLQEALSNIFRRSRSTQVGVSLALRSGRATLRISDDNGGDDGDYQLMRAPIGVGIAGMHAPVDQLGGSLRVTHGPRGTLVTATLPIGIAAATRGAGRRRRGAQRPEG